MIIQKEIQEQKEICDKCGVEDSDILPLSLSCGYGSICDGETLQFCSDVCCAKFILEKIEEKKIKGYCTIPIRDAYQEKHGKI